MARRLPNGAIVDSTGEWYWTFTGWKALVPSPSGKAPGGFMGKEINEARGLARQMSGGSVSKSGELANAGGEAARLVAKLGSLEAAGAELASNRSMAVAKAPTTPKPDVQVKRYKNARDYEADARKMISAGYRQEGQMDQRGKVNMGRTIVKAGVFLPWAIMRPSRGSDSATVTWIREPTAPLAVPAPPTMQDDDVLGRLEKLGELRDKGIVSEEEFESKKADLLSRL